jgi:hypothetical protein
MLQKKITSAYDAIKASFSFLLPLTAFFPTGHACVLFNAHQRARASTSSTSVYLFSLKPHEMRLLHIVTYEAGCQLSPVLFW